MKITKPHINDLRAIQEHPGKSVFWVTDTQARAKRIAALQKNGFLLYEPKQYPYGLFTLTQKALDLLKEHDNGQTV